MFIFFFNFFFFFNIYLFLGQRETEHERGRGRERGRHRIGNRLQALSHQSRAWRGARTHGPRDRDLAEVGCLTDCATQAPLNVYFWERESCRVQVGEKQRERETQNLKQAPGFELSVQSLMQGSNSGTTRSWPEPKLDAQPTEPPRHPKKNAGTILIGIELNV